MKTVNSCIRTNKLPKNIPKGKEPNSCSSKAIYGMAALQGHCQRLFSALNIVSLYLNYREREDCALSPIKVSRKKIPKDLSIPRPSLRFALEHGNKQPGPCANSLDLVFLFFFSFLIFKQLQIHWFLLVFVVAFFISCIKFLAQCFIYSVIFSRK